MEMSKYWFEHNYRHTLTLISLQQRAHMFFKARTNCDSYFNNDDLISQVDMAIDIFERKTNSFATGLFLFDNAFRHQRGHQIHCLLTKCLQNSIQHGVTTRVVQRCALQLSGQETHSRIIITQMTILKCLGGSRAWSKSFMSIDFGQQMVSMSNAKDSSVNPAVQIAVANSHCSHNLILSTRNLTLKN